LSKAWIRLIRLKTAGIFSLSHAESVGSGCGRGARFLVRLENVCDGVFCHQKCIPRVETFVVRCGFCCGPGQNELLANRVNGTRAAVLNDHVYGPEAGWGGVKTAIGGRPNSPPARKSPPRRPAGPLRRERKSSKAGIFCHPADQAAGRNDRSGRAHA
jgi:hypothetical protein